MSSSIMINGRKIGDGEPCYIIAEMSANHGQDYDMAVDIIEAARDAGADAIKMQTYTPDTMTIDCDLEYFKIGDGTIWKGRNLYDLYGEAYTPWDWQPKLKKAAEEMGMDCFSTAYDGSSVKFLETMNVPAYKIASFELVDIHLLKTVARTGKPIVMSTGMASLDEISEAVDAVKGEGNSQIVLLQCTSAYPARPEDMNLNSIPYLAERFGVPVGLSDHTLDNIVPVVAVAQGACVVEKHLTISRGTAGPDSSFSLEPEEFRAMVHAIRQTESALGKVCYELSDAEKPCHVFRRSLFIVEDMRKGAVFTESNIRSIRPGHGLQPKSISEILGRCVSRDVKRGTPLSWDLVS